MFLNDALDKLKEHFELKHIDIKINDGILSFEVEGLDAYTLSKLIGFDKVRIRAVSRITGGDFIKIEIPIEYNKEGLTKI